jgi:tRNA G18 (ribose-2'-O)-methylase SpoU
VALVFGHEVVGLSDEVLTACDQLVRIPAFGVKNSLNVATAFGIVLYDVLAKR